jgi:hypothetical protein
MFRKVLQSISRSLGSSTGKPEGGPPAEAPAPQASPSKSAAPSAAAAAPKSRIPTGTPEERCGITQGMTKSQIANQLKLLYRRYNRAASSLDAQTRQEADIMLDVIVQVREKHFGEI